MMRGIESSIWPVISPQQEAIFRLQLLKIQLGLDHVPTWDKVSTYLRHLAAESGYNTGCTVISKTFLNAPLNDLMSKGRLVIAQSHRILERVRVLSKSEQYVLLGALYGLDASSRAWGTRRDSKLRSLTWRSSQGELCRLHQLRSEPCFWRIETESGRMLGYVGVYVDDLL